jgi:hypothetical protein
MKRRRRLSVVLASAVALVLFTMPLAAQQNEVPRPSDNPDRHPLTLAEPGLQRTG